MAVEQPERNMIMTYNVRLERTYFYEIAVEADDGELAAEKALDYADDDESHWFSNGVTEVADVTEHSQLIEGVYAPVLESDEMPDM